MNVDFCVSSFVTNQDRSKAAIIFHDKAQKRMQPWWHVDPWELPHEAALREVEEELGIHVTLDPQFHDISQWKKDNPWLIPNAVAMQKNIVPPYKDQAEHIHCDFWYILIADESHPFWWEENQSKRMTREEILAIPDDETFLSVKDMANKYLI